MTFARYVAVQLVAYALDLGSFLVLLDGGAGPIPANVAAKILAGGFAFFAHRAFTFGVRGRERIAGEAVRYAVLLALNVPLASGLLAVLLLATTHAPTAKVLADVVCVGLTFVLTRHAVFGRGRAR
jgi:putative flippase GtrA